jgi:hypothetical protein
MQIKITPALRLSDDSGEPRLVRQITGESFGPSDVVQLYPSWEFLPVRVSVARLLEAMVLTESERKMVEAFCRP